MRVRYRGPNQRLTGQLVTVVGHQARGDVYITHPSFSEPRVVSPFTLAPLTEAE